MLRPFSGLFLPTQYHIRHGNDMLLWCRVIKCSLTAFSWVPGSPGKLEKEPRADERRGSRKWAVGNGSECAAHS